MVDYSRIKLVIWDLDETFWRGTLSEGAIEIPEINANLIKQLVDCGVVCSICSKNDMEQAKEVLMAEGLWDLFVFQSIDWENKGMRVKQIIDDMHLRTANVLFIDDNPSNRAEVEHYCSNIITADVCIISEMYKYYDSIEKRDVEHKRLEQYKILERKRDKAQTAGSVNEFLRQSHIRVEIRKDCNSQLDRIEELVLRSNQLNFTKVRSSKGELKKIFDDESFECGYVCVEDDFGQYGLAGFFAIKEGVALHFTFSCRILGMGIEQYVYVLLGKPDVKIVGEVASQLDKPIVNWINTNRNDNTCSQVVKQNKIEKKIVLHGPCDLESIFSFIHDSSNIIKEFTYVNDRGISIESRNCTTHIVEGLFRDEEIKDNESIKRLPFYDKDMYTTKIFDSDIEFVVLSLFTDPCLGCYKEKKTGLIVCFGDACYDLTDESRMQEYIDGREFLHNCVFTTEDLLNIQNEFEYLGRIQPENIISNVNSIYENLSKECKLIITLQSETPFVKATSKFSYVGKYPEKHDNVPRHVYNKKLNDLLKEWAKNKQGVFFLDFNNYIKGQDSFNDHISHFKREVYYEMSCDLVEIINKNSSIFVSNHSKREIRLDIFRKRLNKYLRGIRRGAKTLFKL